MSDALIATTQQLGQLVRRMTPAAHDNVLQAVVHYREEFRRTSATADPVSFAFSVHGLVDEAVASMKAKDPNAPRIRCSRGCDACCYLHVTIEAPEAALLVAYAKDRGLEIDRERLRAQAGADMATWSELPHEARRCVFLGPNGDCQVYEHRPTSCRKYHVVSDPELCDTDRHPGHEVQHIVCGIAEIYASASLTVLESGSMADQLLRVLDAPTGESE